MLVFHNLRQTNYITNLWSLPQKHRPRIKHNVKSQHVSSRFIWLNFMEPLLLLVQHIASKCKVQFKEHDSYLSKMRGIQNMMPKYYEIITFFLMEVLFWFKYVWFGIIYLLWEQYSNRKKRIFRPVKKCDWT